MSFNSEDYNKIRSGVTAYHEQKRGLISVWGKEAVQFLDGMITNDMKTLEDGQQMLAAFPNAKGRLLAVVRVLRVGDRYIFETEEATREKVFQNLYRFTFAGDFFVEDISENYRFFEVIGFESEHPPSAYNFFGRGFLTWAIPNEEVGSFLKRIVDQEHVKISDVLYETLRIESGIPKYGVDMDETTIVPELGIDGMISYNKGCYVGQEIIARIHFRGHVAKRLTGIVLSEPEAIATGLAPGTELLSADGKNAGKITSVIFSPVLDRIIALAYVRYEFLEEGTKLTVGDQTAEVKNLPFI